MKRHTLLITFVIISNIGLSQTSVQIDGRLKPHLDSFFEYCKSYDIEIYDKLFKLKSIDIVDTLKVATGGSTLGMLTRDKHNQVDNIIINHIVLLDEEILKVVAFHEFSHYFLEYKKHTCHDCGEIMAVMNSSYFNIVRDWDYQVKHLFLNSPAYKKKKQIVYHIQPSSSSDPVAN